MDLSYLDKKYFIDPHVYNCPFCKRRNVLYELVEYFEFDWGIDKKCYGYLIECQSKGCNKTSLHLSFEEIRKASYYPNGNIQYGNIFEDSIDIDKKIFYSRPTSFFTLDSRIPHQIRDLIFEAEQSRQENLLVGASACLRKAIYELLKREKSIVVNKETKRADYKESIKALKKKFSSVAPELFDALSNIQEMASDHLHEESWEAWDSPKLRILIELAKATLEEMYVIPDERKQRLSVLGNLKSIFEMDKKTTQTKTQK